MDAKLRSDTFLYGIAKYSTIFVTLLTSAVLARLISPAEYGVITIVTVFSSIFTAVTEMGLGTAVIQNKTLNSEEVNGIFSFTVYAAALLAVIFSFLGFPMGSFYNNPEYPRIFGLLSLSIFFTTMNIVPNALLMKQKRFRLVGKRLIIIACGVGCACIIMARHGFSYYTIVWQHILQTFLTFIWNYSNVRLRFSFRFPKSSIEKIREFSTYQTLYYIINNIARNLDNLTIGKVMGAEALGYYDKSYRLMLYPVQNLTIVLNPILHPILSEYQNDKQYIYDSYLKVVHVLSLLGVYVTLVCFWSAQELVLLFYGDQWEGAIAVFRILSLSVWPQVISSSAGSIYQSTNQTRLMFRSGLVHFSLCILMILIGISTGKLLVLAALVTISQYFRFLIDYYVLVNKNFCLSYKKFLLHFLPETVLLLLFLAVICYAGFKTPWGNIAGLIAKLSIITGCFFLFLWKRDELKKIRILFSHKRK